MNTIKKIEKGMNAFTWAFNYIAIAALTFNVLIIVLDVVRRRFFGSAIIGSSEYVSMAEIVLIFCAIGYTQYNHGLVHITFFMRKFPKLTPIVFWTIHEWLGAAITVLLTYASWMQADVVKKYGITTTSLQIPHYPFHIIMALGFFAYAVVQTFSAVKSTVGLFNKEVRQDVMDNWPA